MLIHTYTWQYLVEFTLLFSLISYIFARRLVTRSKIKFLILLLIICTTFSMDYYSKSLFVPNYYSASLSSDSPIIRNVLGIQDQESMWDRLYFTLGTYVGGYLSNPILFLLTLSWILLADPRRTLDRILLSMSFMISIPLLVGTVEFQTRLLYNMPFQIPAAIMAASAAIIPFSAKNIEKNSRRQANQILLLIAILAVLTTYAVRAIVNLYLITPEGYTLGSQFLLP